MSYRNFLHAVVLVFGGLCVPSYGTITESFDQSGFYPDPVALNSWTSDCVTVNLVAGDQAVEIPSGECTYSWSVSGVWQDNDFDGPNDFADVFNSSDPMNGSIYNLELCHADRQTCTLRAKVSTEGYFYVKLDVTVNYPDGYTRTFQRDIHVAPRDRVLLAGEASIVGVA